MTHFSSLPSNHPALPSYLIVLTAIIFCPPAAAHASDDLPPYIRAALERNAESLGPVDIEYRHVYSSPLGLHQLLELLHFTNETEFDPKREHFAYDPSGMFYYRYEFRSKLKGQTDVYVSEEEVACDNESIFRGKAPQKGANAAYMVDTIGRVPRSQAKTSFWHDARFYLHHAGFKLPNLAVQAGTKARSAVLHLLAEGGRVTEAADTAGEYLVAISVKESVHRFWLDPTRGYAVARQTETRQDGDVRYSVENSDLVELSEPSLWLPRHVHVEFHSYDPHYTEVSGDPILIVDTEISAMSRKTHPKEEFRLTYAKPGTWISDSRLPGAEKSATGRLDYAIPADQSQLDAVLEESRGRVAAAYDMNMNRRWWWWVRLTSIIGGIVVVGALVTWQTIRLIHKRRTILER
jgi:hypothetical protein